jgi:hypothetical protein
MERKREKKVLYMTRVDIVSGQASVTEIMVVQENEKNVKKLTKETNVPSSL